MSLQLPMKFQSGMSTSILAPTSLKKHKRFVASVAIATLAILMLLAVYGLRLNGDTKATAGTVYTKIGLTKTTNYLDKAVISGQVLHYYVTATTAEDESAPTPVVTVQIPTTPGPHSASLTWTAPRVDSLHRAATGYNIYRAEEKQPQAGQKRALNSADFRFRAVVILRRLRLQIESMFRFSASLWQKSDAESTSHEKRGT